MYKKIVLFSLITLMGLSLMAQTVDPISIQSDSDVIQVAQNEVKEEEPLPVVTYTLNNNKKHTIADIKVSGVESFGHQDYVLIGISGLAVGDRVAIPGDEITKAIDNFWKHGLFSDVVISASKMTADSVWLDIALKPNPIISEINFQGVKRGEREDLEARAGVTRGSQLTPNIVDRVKKRITDYFDEKGFNNAEVKVQQRNDLSMEGRVILDIIVDKQEKTKVKNIFITGNETLSDYDIKVAMKKTNEGFDLKRRFRLSWRKMFSTKKFVVDEYKADLEKIIQKYNEKGYRDANIVADSVVFVSEKKVNVYVTVDEGDKYYIRNLKWVGNTLYNSDLLEDILTMQAGDVYNQTKLDKRLLTDEDAVQNVYHNRGYLFARMTPVETYVGKDSVDIEIRVIEGIQATINKVVISGNDRLYEDIIRRELMTKPGQLFSKEVVMNSAREIAQMGHFDPENMDIQPIPDYESGTVDINYNLVSKANDQIELSAGYGQTGILGRLSLKFTNFSFKNLVDPSTYRGIIPQGDGQTLTLSGQTNGRYYQSYSVSFLDPWFGGKRPNSLSLSAYYVVQTGVDYSYYEDYLQNYYLNSYSGNYGDYTVYDDNTKMRILGFSAGYGKRLNWPDPRFHISAELSYQRYWLRNWNWFPVQNGDCNNLALNLTLSRSSIDNPLYTRSGSSFMAKVSLTPPYSLWDGKDYASMTDDSQEKNKWIEYHKWKFAGKIFIPLANPESVKRTPVLMSRIEYGFLGSYTANKRSPFETYYMGGDGMSGYSSSYYQETIALRGYKNGSLTPYGSEGYAYSRLALEFRYPFLLEQSATVYGLAFVEAGNAWTDAKLFNPFDLKRSAGVGARVFLPMIGLLGIDWAYGFDSTPGNTEANGSELHFIIGQEF